MGRLHNIGTHVIPDSTLSWANLRGFWDKFSLNVFGVFWSMLKTLKIENPLINILKMQHK